MRAADVREPGGRPILGPRPRSQDSGPARGLRADGGRPAPPVPADRHHGPAGERAQGGRSSSRRCWSAKGIAVEIDEFAPAARTCWRPSRGAAGSGRSSCEPHRRGAGRPRALVRPALLRHAQERDDLRPRRAGHEGGGHPPTPGLRPRSSARVVALDRDVLFLATADEEADFAGALRALSPEGWGDRLRAGRVLPVTEGGENLLDDQGRPNTSASRPAQKAAFLARSQDHGDARARLAAHRRLGAQPAGARARPGPPACAPRSRCCPRWKVLPSTRRGACPSRARSWYRDIRKAVEDPEAARALYDDREVSALLRNTVSITVVQAGLQDERHSRDGGGGAGRAAAPGRGPAGVPGRAARRDRRPHGRDHPGPGVPPQPGEPHHHANCSASSSACWAGTSPGCRSPPGWRAGPPRACSSGPWESWPTASRPLLPRPAREPPRTATTSVFRRTPCAARRGSSTTW